MNFVFPIWVTEGGIDFWKSIGPIWDIEKGNSKNMCLIIE